jgi:hypothetical protein
MWDAWGIKYDFKTGPVVSRAFLFPFFFETALARSGRVQVWVDLRKSIVGHPGVSFPGLPEGGYPHRPGGEPGLPAACLSGGLSRRVDGM